MVKKKNSKVSKSKISKKSKKIIRWSIVSVAILVISIAVYVQVMINITTQQKLDSVSLFQFRSLIRDAIVGLNDIKEKPEFTENEIIIKELGIKFPINKEYLSNANSILYSYYDWRDIEEDSRVELEVTTSEIANIGLSYMNGNTIEELISKVPQAQACSRGYKLSKVDLEKINTLGDDDVKIFGKVNLSSGETLYIYKENLCIAEDSIENLGKFLLTADSI